MLSIHKKYLVSIVPAVCAIASAVAVHPGMLLTRMIWTSSYVTSIRLQATAQTPDGTLQRAMADINNERYADAESLLTGFLRSVSRGSESGASASDLLISVYRILGEYELALKECNALLAANGGAHQGLALVSGDMATMIADASDDQAVLKSQVATVQALEAQVSSAVSPTAKMIALGNVALYRNQHAAASAAFARAFAALLSDPKVNERLATDVIARYYRMLWGRGRSNTAWLQAHYAGLPTSPNVSPYRKRRVLQLIFQLLPDWQVVDMCHAILQANHSNDRSTLALRREAGQIAAGAALGLVASRYNEAGQTTTPAIPFESKRRYQSVIDLIHRLQWAHAGQLSHYVELSQDAEVRVDANYQLARAAHAEYADQWKSAADLYQQLRDTYESSSAHDQTVLANWEQAAELAIPLVT